MKIVERKFFKNYFPTKEVLYAHYGETDEHGPFIEPIQGFGLDEEGEFHALVLDQDTAKLVRAVEFDNFTHIEGRR